MFHYNYIRSRTVRPGNCQGLLFQYASSTESISITCSGAGENLFLCCRNEVEQFVTAQPAVPELPSYAMCFTTGKNSTGLSHNSLQPLTFITALIFFVLIEVGKLHSLDVTQNQLTTFTEKQRANRTQHYQSNYLNSL